jgi:hypothetical protein
LLSIKDGRRIDSARTCVGDVAEITGIDRRMTGVTLDNFEDLMLRAAKLQAERPHRCVATDPSGKGACPRQARLDC